MLTLGRGRWKFPRKLNWSRKTRDFSQSNGKLMIVLILHCHSLRLAEKFRAIFSTNQSNSWPIRRMRTDCLPDRVKFSFKNHYLIPVEAKYSQTSLFRTRLIRSPRYFEGRSNALGFTLPLYASPVISKPRYFELFFSFPLGLRNSEVRL